ncbi:hypothetical protein RM531_05875 [Salinisphaera sp. P385]|uniref:ABC-type transport auxiliary lipoprotein component domain-containing protein n=1 Tax=Spectribacter acetivorans TaxID=3075603 RepID=A0ABU3B6C1_9GAMM|nr:hypothetical protein [Salinisphaera sp. P385]MDT0617994.1 hypothetical protein [Salinisphaera sp. P385]
MTRWRRARGRLVVAGVAGFLAAGCGTTPVAPDAVLPDPVVAEQARRIALVISPEFRQRRYTDDDWNIGLGEPAEFTFGRTLDALYRDVRVTDTPDASGVDLIVVPTWADAQISGPGDSHGEFHEAWLHFDVRLLDDAGAQVDRWPIRAYGRSRDRLLGDDEAVAEAVERALRDAATALILKLRGQSIAGGRTEEALP